MVGSRGSRLALAQTRQVVDAMLRADPRLDCRIAVIRTGGDVACAPLSEIGGVGVFVKEIEDALLRGKVDFAVHSAKDLPAEMDSRLLIAACPEREDPSDALVSAAADGLNGLPQEARVGTGSQRRRAQLLNARPDLNMLEIRGNVDTRLRKLDEGEYDAVVLACAGLRRLGLENRISEVLPPEVCLPAAGQGALVVQCRAGDKVAGVLARIDHLDTRRCVEAERDVLRLMGAGCRTPIGVLARIVDGDVLVEAMVVSPDGSEVVREQASGDGAAERVADRLLASALD